jgi:inorganic pyrophosphatase
MDLSKLPTRDREKHVRVVVESPRGSGVKLKYDPELGAFALSRPLPLGVTYPFDWGFVPGTRAADGDPLDAMVLLDCPSYPGVVVACSPIGVVRVEQDAREGGRRERNDRVIAVAASAPRFEAIKDAMELPERLREEIQQFFLTAVLFEKKNASLLGWDGKAAAEALVDESSRRKAA